MAIEPIEPKQRNKNLPAVMPDTTGLTPAAAQKVLDREIDPIPLPTEMRHVLYSIIASHPGKTMRAFQRVSNIMLEEYNIAITAEEVSKAYYGNVVGIVEVRKRQRGVSMIDKPTVQNKAEQLMNRHLDRAVKDFDKLDALDAALHAGAITAQEHARAAKKLRLLSVNDLVKIANHVSPDKPTGGYLYPPSDAPEQPEGTDTPGSPQSSALAKALNEAVKRGDEVEIQRILWSQNSSAQSSPKDSSNSEPPQLDRSNSQPKKPTGRPRGSKNKKPSTKK